MQEQKEFGTALFGFEKKAVLEYIYEQDKQARGAMEELARRNAALEDERRALDEKQHDLSTRYEEMCESAAADRQKSKETTDECDRLKERLAKLSTQFHDKENSLQLQMEINKKMQLRIAEQQTLIEKLQNELHSAEDRLQIFQERQQDFIDMRDRLERFKNEFTRRLAEFEDQFAKLEAFAAPESPAIRSRDCTRSDTAKTARVSPRVRPEDDRYAATVPSVGGTGSAPAGRNRLKSIFDEWK